MPWDPDLATPDAVPRRGWFAGQHATNTVPVAAATAAGLLPVMGGGSGVTAPIAAATADTIIPVLVGGSTVTAPLAAATAAGIVPVVGHGSGIVAPVAVATADTIAPSLIEGSTVTVPLAAATADGLAPAVGSGSGVVAPVADASADALVPVAGGGSGAVAPVAAATADGLAPIVSSGQTATAPVAASTADGLVPAVGGGSGATAPLATATADALVPAVGGGAGVDVPVAAATADGLVPAVGAGATVVVPVAAATADALVPAAGVSYDGPVTAPLATATADGVVPVVSAGATVTVPLATATADGLVPAAGGGSGVTVPVAAATAAGIVPVVAAVDPPSGPMFYDDFEFYADGDFSPQADADWVSASMGGSVPTVNAGVLYGGDGTVFSGAQFMPWPGGGPLGAATSFQAIEITAAADWANYPATGLYLRVDPNLGLDVDSAAIGFGALIGGTSITVSVGGVVQSESGALTEWTWSAGDVLRFEVQTIGGEAVYSYYTNGVLIDSFTDPDNRLDDTSHEQVGMFMYEDVFPDVGGIDDFAVYATAPPPPPPNTILPGVIAGDRGVYAPTSISGPAVFRNRWHENATVSAGTAIPSGAKYYNFRGIGAGGGGGTGRYSGSGTVRYGGGGGGGGGYLDIVGGTVPGSGTYSTSRPASGGAAAPQQTTTGNNGTTGTTGGNAVFAFSAGDSGTATGGGGGGAGTGSASVGGAGGVNVVSATGTVTNETGSAGASSNAGTATPSNATASTRAGGGGGAGGGLPTGNTQRAGSNGASVSSNTGAFGAAGGLAGGSAGSATAGNGDASDIMGGGGGGGSGSRTTTGTHSGSAGAGYGGGGGGGGAKQAASTANAGAGAPGYNRLDFTNNTASRLLSVARTYTQSSVYSGSVAATEANMNNQVAAGAGGASATNNAGNEYIQVDLGASRTIKQVVVGYDYNTSYSGWGPVYTQGAILEFSTDNATWTAITAVTLPIYTDVSALYPDGLVPIAVSGTARYARVRKTTGWLQLTEFQVWGS